MLTTQLFNKEFKKRHDFNYDDVNYLPNKYRSIKFTGIPEAWVYPIDKFLSNVKNPEKITSISQVMGFLSIDANCNETYDLEQLNKMEKSIKTLDIDLYNELSNNNKELN